MELTFKTEKKKIGANYLRFLPKNLRFIGGLSIFLNILSFLIVLVFYTRLQKEIPLFYSLPSDQQLIDKKFIFILPGIAAAMNFAHLLIAYLEKEINQNILKMFIQITLLLQVLVLAILLRVIIIVY
jgi:hypothetical protein